MELGPLCIDATPITLFVGPNNSGKSRVLIEIENYCRSTQANPNDLIIKGIEFSPYDEKEFLIELSKIEVRSSLEKPVPPGHVRLRKINPQNNRQIEWQGVRDQLIQEATNPSRRQGYYGGFLNMFTARLDGANRLGLLAGQQAGNLKDPTSNHLLYLFHHNELRKKIRRIIFDAFGKFFVIDPTDMGKLEVRLSDREPVDDDEEKGWDTRQVEFHKKAISIQQTSDGVKAFGGIITTLLAGDPKILLIDEPEAFLHPALSSMLGKEIGNTLRNTKKRLFASTHSSSFLMGCVQSGIPLNIVRLTYNYQKATARLLPKEKIIHLMRQPLLRSTGVLTGLFYESVVVTEADTDRAFYQEVNERLLAKKDPRAIKSCLFINAHSKQSVWEIVKPLRELGIPTAAIVDIDIVKEGGTNWNKVLDGSFIPEQNHGAFQSLRQVTYEELKKTDKNMKRDGGIELLTGQAKEGCKDFFRQLNGYGTFVVANGEIESWLKQLGATGHGPSWLIDIFEKMGENPDDANNYVGPGQGDVWDFIGELNNWIANPEKKGVPIN